MSFVPVFSNKPSSPMYAEYCRNQLVKLRPWFGDLRNTWDGQQDEAGDISDKAAILVLQLVQRPRGFSARDLQAARRRRRQRTGTGDDPEEQLESDDDDNVDGLHGGGGGRPTLAPLERRAGGLAARLRPGRVEHKSGR